MNTTNHSLATLERHSFSDIGGQKWQERHQELTVQNVPTMNGIWTNIRQGGRGVIPLENSASFIEVVGRHLETLWQTECRIEGVVRQTIEMCLTGRHPELLRVLSETRGESFTLFSHAKALEQCSDRLDEWDLLERMEKDSTAAGVDVVAHSALLENVALGSRIAIEARNLPVVDCAMANLPPAYNKTLLGIIKGGSVDFPDAGKENHAFVLIPENKPGVLADMTQILRGTCDLQKIDSFKVDARHAGFFIPLRRRDGVDAGQFGEAMCELYAYDPLKNFDFQSLDLLPKKKQKFDPARQKSIVCLGSWSDDDVIET